MGRCVVWAMGMVFFALTATSATAQETAPVAPQSLGLPPIPKVEATFGPPIAVEAPHVTELKTDIEVSPNTGLPRLEGSQEPRPDALVELAARSTEYIDPRYVANSAHPDLAGIWERSRTHAGDQIHRLINDYREFYLTRNLFTVGLAVAVAAPIANTHADQGIRDWYQRQAGNGQSRSADETARVFKTFGEYQYAIPIYLALSFTGNLCADYPALGKVGEFGDRSWRALAVGAPMVGILQVGLGSGRPDTENSHWIPFRHSNGASGHAFVGAVPFLTAAAMTDSYVLKTLLIAGSFGTAWSRVQDDAHYTSQALLGWSIACVAVHAVNQTESRFQLMPVAFPNGMGMGVHITY